MSFTAEEFLDLWTTPYSDCVNIEGWNAPTAYDIVQFMKSQNPANTSLEEVIEHIKRNFTVEKNWEKLMRILGQNEVLHLKPVCLSVVRFPKVSKF